MKAEKREISEEELLRELQEQDMEVEFDLQYLDEQTGSKEAVILLLKLTSEFYFLCNEI